MEFKEDIAICYTCCGPTYRKTAKDKLLNLYKDNDSLYYFILTDDKAYFEDVYRQNLVVNELKDFYHLYPWLEKYEWFLESENEEDYANKFLKTGYTFPFSTMRFHLLQALKAGVHNVALLGTDVSINFNRILDDPNFFVNKNIIYNSVTAWYALSKENDTNKVVAILENKDYKVDEEIMVFDAAARLFTFESIEKMMQVFHVWNDVIKTLYEEDKIKHFSGGYARNDEYILAPIYNALGIKAPSSRGAFITLFDVRHNPEVERFWMVY